ncbi:protein ABHD18-like [Clavelina lepadiformis]|uniref:protein ABHD18-like n=1 Tax=Clavelina lepadiformis TaxID=159417 RepID=UPI0040433320
MGLSKTDLLFRKLVLTKFYTRGWGRPDVMKKIFEMHKLISNRETCSKLVSPNYEVVIDKEINFANYKLIHGHFITPLMDYLPKLVPVCAQVATFEVVINKSKVRSDSHGPACIHMAGTGDHGFQRRREMIAKPLLKSGITSVLLENPFYGTRKPKEQFRSGLLHVTDLFVMGGCLILEAQVLLHWLKRIGYGPLGVTGISMGGHMASLAGTNWPEPIAIVPCMSWTSSSVVWTEGVLSKAIPWRTLEMQYARNPEYEKEILNMLHHIDSYKLGMDFVTSKGVLKPKSERVSQEDDDNIPKKNTDTERRQQETVKFMKGVMDEITHLGNYSVPVDPSAATFVIAKDDAYFPQSSLTHMSQVWPGCEVREMNSGHVSGFLIHNSAFRSAIVDTFERLMKTDKHASAKKQSGEIKEENGLCHSKPANSVPVKSHNISSFAIALKAFVLKS